MLKRIWVIAAVATIVACETGQSSDHLVPEGSESKAHATETSNNTPGDTTSTAELLVDDFEDGDQWCELGGSWETSDDAMDKGRSALTIALDSSGHLIMDGEGHASARSFHFTFALDQGDFEYAPYIWWWVILSSDAEPVDFSRYEGFSYWHKGSAHRATLTSPDVKDYDYHSSNVAASDDWQKVEIAFADLRQLGWGEPRPLDLGRVVGFTWLVEGQTGDTGEVWLDNLTLVEQFPEPDRGAPDLEIHPAEPPPDAFLDSTDIANPLQVLAMKSLNRGYAITNWLEQYPFAGFGQYDESFVEKLAAAGFLGLRLPIDLDLFLEDREAYFAGNAPLAVDPTLFTVLDAFDQWTGAHGLSLTIDYHQYDGSADLRDPLAVGAMLELWSAVAKHFAGNAREDLFFELLNEPEIAGDVSHVSAETWTDVAKQLIAEIRAQDDQRVLIFGDVEYYGIDALQQRTPFDDERIIYAFHFYEPFLFTHQGASWTDLGTVYDIPYPYSAARWSGYASDFGLSGTPSWLLAVAGNYYREGNHAALRNRLVEVKQWAVRNDVPVICNEFGAYDRTSQLADRVAYATDLVDIFTELQIPWQRWFMSMNQEGEVVPELATALGLDGSR